MRVLVCLLALVAVAHATSKIESLKAKVLAARNGDDFTTPAECRAKGGSCQLVSGCTGAGASVVRHLCPGDSSIACCVRAGTTPTPTPTPQPTTPATGLAGLLAIADNAAFSSGCTRFNWADRGTAPRSFIKGVLATFAKTVCRPSRPDVVFVGNANKGTNDALAWYADKLAILGSPVTGITTVRQLYTLLIGLGMKESSGQWCVGRDTSASFTKAETAEAGLFQTSWGANTRSPLMGQLMTQYSASSAGCLASTFKAGVSCKAADLQNWGKSSDMGFQWQAKTKDCPAFSTEYAAVLLRLNGGSKGEWGPLRKKVVQINKTCYDMLGAAQTYVAANPSVCNDLYA